MCKGTVLEINKRKFYSFFDNFSGYPCRRPTFSFLLQARHVRDRLSARIYFALQVCRTRTAAFWRADRKRKCGTRPLGLPSIIRRFFFRLSHRMSFSLRFFFFSPLSRVSFSLLLSSHLIASYPSPNNNYCYETRGPSVRPSARYLFLSFPFLFHPRIPFSPPLSCRGATWIIITTRPRRRPGNRMYTCTRVVVRSRSGSKRNRTKRRRSERNEPLRGPRKMYASIRRVPKVDRGTFRWRRDGRCFSRRPRIDFDRGVFIAPLTYRRGGRKYYVNIDGNNIVFTVRGEGYLLIFITHYYALDTKIRVQYSFR